MKYRYVLLSGIGLPIFFFLATGILALFYPGYNHAINYVSELGAVDSPVWLLMTIFGFVPMGLSMLAFSVGLFNFPSIGNWGKTGAVVLFIASVSMVLIGLFPCDAGCANSSFTGFMHEVTADFPFYAGITAMTFMFLEFVGKKEFRPLVIALVLTVVLTTTFTYVNLHTDVQRPGLVQRINMVFPFLFIGFASVYLFYMQSRRLGTSGKEMSLGKQSKE